MRESTGRNASVMKEYESTAKRLNVSLRGIEFDVASEDSCKVAVQEVVNEAGRLDVVIHNAGHMTFGPLEAFTPEQIADEYDVNAVGTQRRNRAALPVMRKQRSGLVIWNSSGSAAGGTPPYLGPYFAANAGMDAFAVAYAKELTRWGIETSIVVPGAFYQRHKSFRSCVFACGSLYGRRIRKWTVQGICRASEDGFRLNRSGRCGCEQGCRRNGRDRKRTQRQAAFPCGNRRD